MLLKLKPSGPFEEVTWDHVPGEAIKQGEGIELSLPNSGEVEGAFHQFKDACFRITVAAIGGVAETQPAEAIVIPITVTRPATAEVNLAWPAVPLATEYTVRLVDIANADPLDMKTAETKLCIDNLEAGHFYRVEIKVSKWKEGDDLLITSGSATFRAELTQDELKELYRCAEGYVTARYNATKPLLSFHRAKGPDYFEYIEKSHDNIMKVAGRIKDKNGDRASPINGVLEGLFFSANVHFRTGELLTSSPFGSKRVLISPEAIYQEMSKLYFADFYCNMTAQNPHYVTLVMVKNGSQADKFCQKKKLYKLDVENNPFVQRDRDGAWLVTTVVWVEILCTEDIDITGKVLEVVEWDGIIRNKGIEKTAGCKTCNL